nr:FAD-dependent oxidoreductase [Actinomycetales bacterium]
TVPMDGSPVEAGELLLVGGNGHKGGQFDSARDAVEDLHAWTAAHFPGAEPTHAWSAQDYQALDRVPYVGPMPRGGDHIYVATGFDKWGMTNGVAAGLALSAQILGGQMPWAETLKTRSTTAAGVGEAIAVNVDVAVNLAKDWVNAELNALPEEPPAEGEGVVGRGANMKPEGVSTVDGLTCRVSAICTHLGGVLRWNNAERSWDCPLHGSRYDARGALLEGPAVTDLKVLE